MASRLDGFQKLALATTVVTYLLIIVGASVRASGAGLGCPDWPLCFGLLVPPLSAESLPAGYDPADFSAVRTWTEYGNRLFGVLTGVLITATFAAALALHRRNRRVLYAAAAAFVLVGFEGWQGGRVVADRLAPGTVSLHLLGALLIVSILLYATVAALLPAPLAQPSTARRRIGWTAWGLLILTLGQVVLGAEVRGRIDRIVRSMEATRDSALELVGPIDITHRQLSLVVLAAAIALGVHVWRRSGERGLVLAAAAVVLVSGAQILVGLALAYLDMPPVAQVTHVSLSSLLIGAQTLLALLALRLPEKASSGEARSLSATARG
jgi:cytochrome c oxidase assembly protein subunit 15